MAGTSNIKGERKKEYVYTYINIVSLKSKIVSFINTSLTFTFCRTSRCRRGSDLVRFLVIAEIRLGRGRR